MFNMKTVLTVFFALSVSKAMATSQVVGDEAYFTLGSVTVEEFAGNNKTVVRRKTKAFVQKTLVESPELDKDLSEIGAVIAVGREIIAFGEEVYALIERGRPVVNAVNATPISVLPKLSNGQTIDILDMENWKLPKSKKVRLSYKNLYGMTVVAFDYLVIFSYGGTHNGKGAYLTGVQIVPAQVDVAWGYTFNAEAKLQTITNLGTKTSPIAAANMNLHYKVETVFKTMESNDTFTVTGKGELVDYQ